MGTASYFTAGQWLFALPLFYALLAWWARRHARKLDQPPAWTRRNSLTHESLDLLPGIRALLKGQRPTQTRLSRFLIAAVPLALGILISADAFPVRGTGIVAGFNNAFDPQRWANGVDATTLLFGLLSLYFLWLLPHRLSGEDRETKDKEVLAEERRRELQASIMHAPSFTVIEDYATRHKLILEAVQPSSPPAGTDQRTHNAHQLQKALGVFALLTRDFIPRREDAFFRANLMVYVPPGLCRLYGKEVIQETWQFETDGFDPGGAGGMLLMDPLLTIDGLPETDPQPYKRMLTLPVPLDLRRDGTLQALPGAPTALLLDEGFAVQPDTRKMADEATYLRDTVRDNLRQYFAEDGEGAAVRSFISLSIGPPENRVGVLNIDAGVPHVIGDYEDFNATYLALVRPLLQLIEPLVRTYAEQDSRRSPPPRSGRQKKGSSNR